MKCSVLTSLFIVLTWILYHTAHPVISKLSFPEPGLDEQLGLVVMGVLQYTSWKLSTLASSLWMQLYHLDSWGSGHQIIIQEILPYMQNMFKTQNDSNPTT